MRISDYKISICRAGRNIWHQRTMQCIPLDVPFEIVLIAAIEANKEHEDVLALMSRSKNVRSTNFNLRIVQRKNVLVTAY